MGGVYVSAVRFWSARDLSPLSFGNALVIWNALRRLQRKQKESSDQPEQSKG